MSTPNHRLQIITGGCGIVAGAARILVTLASIEDLVPGLTLPRAPRSPTDLWGPHFCAWYCTKKGLGRALINQSGGERRANVIRGRGGS
jgi:hypothetical protein